MKKSIQCKGFTKSKMLMNLIFKLGQQESALIETSFGAVG